MAKKKSKSKFKPFNLTKPDETTGSGRGNNNISISSDFSINSETSTSSSRANDSSIDSGVFQPCEEDSGNDLFHSNAEVLNSARSSENNKIMGNKKFFPKNRQKLNDRIANKADANLDKVRDLSLSENVSFGIHHENNEESSNTGTKKKRNEPKTYTRNCDMENERTRNTYLDRNRTKNLYKNEKYKSDYYNARDLAAGGNDCHISNSDVKHESFRSSNYSRCNLQSEESEQEMKVYDKVYKDSNVATTESYDSRGMIRGANKSHDQTTEKLQNAIPSDNFYESWDDDNACYDSIIHKGLNVDAETFVPTPNFHWEADISAKVSGEQNEALKSYSQNAHQPESQNRNHKKNTNLQLMEQKNEVDQECGGFDFIQKSLINPEISFQDENQKVHHGKYVDQSVDQKRGVGRGWSQIGLNQKSSSYLSKKLEQNSDVTFIKDNSPKSKSPDLRDQHKRGYSLGNERNYNKNWRTKDDAENKHNQMYEKRHSEGNDIKSKEHTNFKKPYSDPKVTRQSRELFDRDYENIDKEYKIFQEDRRRKVDVDFEKVKEIQQDLFAMSKEYSLAHCVAEDFRMGSGIAVSFKRDFKDIDILFSQRQKQGGVAILEQDGRIIYYLVTKRVSNGKPTYETLWSSLKKMRDHIKEHNVEKLAIPRLGCGLDRLEWNAVKHMIEFLFREVNVEITVCNFQQTEDSPEKPQNITCKVVHVKKPIADIEEETSIIYLSTQDGDVSTEMEQLNKKYPFLGEFKSSRKELGDLIKYKVPKKYYILNGCIVRKTKTDLFDFKSFRKCIQQINRDCRKEKYVYVAIQAIKDNHDDLINEKIITILKNYLNNIDVYVCWDEDLVSQMPERA